MFKEKNFMRNKNVEATFNQEVICANNEIIEAITERMEKYGWEFKDFEDIIKFTGLDTPIKLKKNGKKTFNSFKCTTKYGKKLIINIDSDGGPYVKVIQDTDIKIYRFWRKWVEDPKELAIGFAEREITRNGKNLCNYYYDAFVSRVLNIDGKHFLTIDMYEPKPECNKEDKIVLRKCEEVEDFLLTLDTSLIVSQVYDKVMELMGLTEDDILYIPEISITYEDGTARNRNVRSTIVKKFGKMEEYAVLENGETFHVRKDGCWHYISDEGTVDYLKDEKRYAFNLKVAEEDIGNLNLNGLMSRVKKRISELWKYVE